jgi:hypothetical protein
MNLQSPSARWPMTCGIYSLAELYMSIRLLAVIALEADVDAAF